MSCVIQLQDLEHELQIGQPGSQGAGQPDELDFGTRISKLAYHEGHVALCKSAKFVLGVERVHRIGEALVQVFFFRDKQVTDGKQWIDSFSLPEGRGDFTFVNPAEAVEDHIQEHQKTYVQDAQALAEVVGKVAGVSAIEVCGLLKTYTAVFIQEMKERGFRLVQSIFHLISRRYTMRRFSVVQWHFSPIEPI